MHAPPSRHDRPAPLNGEFALRVGLAWLAIAALLVVVNGPRIAGGLFPDPDDTMRLIQVRDWLAGQSWFDVTQYRADAPGGGVPMHWSRLVDVPLGAMIVLLTPLIGPVAAENAAIILVPLLTLAAAMILAARIAWRLLGAQETTLTVLILALSVPVIFQLGPLRIDHHGWQLVCALAAMNGLMARSAVRGGSLIGASLAVWLAISIEGMPLAAAFFAVLAWRWLRDRDQRMGLASAILALFLTSAALFMATRGLADLGAYCDAISPVHIAMFGLGVLVLGPLALLDRRFSVPVLLAGFALAGGSALALLFHAAPQCVIGGGFAALDPLVAQYWHANVAEGMPVWRQELQVALQFAITPLIGLHAARNLARQAEGGIGQYWQDYALVMLAAWLVSLMVARAGAVACLIAAPPLAWQVRRWLRAIRLIERPPARIAAMIGVMIALLPAFPFLLLASAMPARAIEGGAARAGEGPRVSACQIAQTARLVSDLEPGEIYAPLDIAPQLLLDTPHSVIATGHHRGNQAMKLVIETALAPADEAEAMLRARGTRYIALCPDLGEPGIYASTAPAGFMAQLVGGNAPLWLEPISLDTDASFRIWRIRPD